MKKNNMAARAAQYETIVLESKEACFSMIDNLKLVRRATNLFDNKTLASSPPSSVRTVSPSSSTSP